MNRKSLAALPEACDNSVMLNIGSLVIGAIALVLAVFAFIPLLGWANWVIVPFAVVGLALGAMSDKTSGRNLNIVVIVIGVIRLMLGGGII
jgi:hypothetical protein